MKRREFAALLSAPLSMFSSTRVGAASCGKGTKIVGGVTVCTPQCVDHVNCKIGQDHRGNASTWLGNPPPGYRSRDNGSKHRPREGGIIVWAASGTGALRYGHVAYVEHINTDKDEITISESNWDGRCNLGNRTLKYKRGSDKRYRVDEVAGWLEKK